MEALWLSIPVVRIAYMMCMAFINSDIELRARTAWGNFHLTGESKRRERERKREREREKTFCHYFFCSTPAIAKVK